MNLGAATMGTGVLAAVDPMDHVVPHTLFEIPSFLGGGFTALDGMVYLPEKLPFTNHLLMSLIAAALMLLIFPLLARDYPMAPRGIRNLFESLMEFIRKEVAQPSLHEHTDKFMPFLWTVFFFILFNNLLGMIPLDAFSTVVAGKSHIFGTATSGLSITAGLALVSFLVFHGSGVVAQYHHGVEHGSSPGAAAIAAAPRYLNSMVPHVPGVIGLILYLPLLLLEFALSFVKPFALAIRLFANMFAGHTVLASLLLLAPAGMKIASLGVSIPTVLGCAGLSCLELFVAFLQAYIFTFLTAMFIGAAVSPDH